MRLFSTLLFLCIFHSLTAQSDTWTYFTPPPSVNSLAARGNAILAGTNGAGIVRFDTLGNRTFVNTGNSAIPSDSIRQLAIDAQGHWWIQHPGGFSRFDGAGAQTWSLSQTGLPAAAVVRTLKPAPDSSLYVITDSGAAIFKAGAWSVLNTSNSGLPTNNLWDVAFGAGGRLYFASTGSGIVIWDGASWASYTTANTGIQTINNVYSVALTDSGVLWAIGGINATATVRLAKFEAGTWTGYTGISIGISSGSILRKLSVDERGRLWLLTSTTVSVYQQSAWTHYYANGDIGCSLGTTAPAIDGAGRVWVESGCQLSHFDGQTWGAAGTGLAGPSWGYMYDGIAEDADGSIWLCTEFGGYIARLDGDTWEQYVPTSFGASANDVYSVQADAGGAMWFGLDKGEILRYDQGNWTFFDTCSVAFPSHIVLTSAGAPNGDRWFSLFSTNTPTTGLARYGADGQWQFFTQANSPLPPSSYVRKILIEANGTAWITTANANKGIFRYNGTAWDSITVNNSTLPHNRVYYLAQAPDGAIWACTDAGLARFDGSTWTTLNTSNSGLPSNLTRRIAFDQAGGMYVGYAPQTSGAPGARVAVLRGGVWTELIPPNWTNSLQDEPDAFFVDSQNRLWFAKSVDNNGGVYRYDPMLVNTEEPVAARPLFSAAPNPTSGLLTLRLETPLGGEGRLDVWNAFGHRVLQRVIPQKADTVVPVDLSALPAGMYWVRLWVDGGTGTTVRVVKG